MTTLQIITYIFVFPVFVWGLYWVIHDLREWMVYLGWIKTPEYKKWKKERDA